MKKLLTIAYDGSEYLGYATQPHKHTIQDQIEKALKNIYKQDIKTFAASRTDKGVHAIDQKIQFEEPFHINVDNLKKALSSMLDDAIFIIKVEDVDDYFNCRYDVKAKEYIYVISNDTLPFNRKYKTCYQYNLDIEKMQEASKYLLGRHDFSSFCSAKSGKIDKIRTIFDISIKKINNDIIFTFKGDGFLYNMIRIIVGTFIEIGSNNLEVKDIQFILASKNRKNAAKTAPPNGLYLTKIHY